MTQTEREERYRVEPLEGDEYGCKFGVVCDSSVEPGTVIVVARFYEREAAEASARRGNDYINRPRY